MDEATRKIIIDNLKTKEWFKKSTKSIQKELLELPEEFEGFLKDLGNRSEQIGDIRVNKLISIARGNFLITPVFEVESVQTLEKYTYEYASWKYGKETGSRGIIFLTVDGVIKYFIVRRTQRFPLAK